MNQGALNKHEFSSLPSIVVLTFTRGMCSVHKSKHHHHNVMFMNFSPPLNLCTLFTKGFWKYKPNEEFGDGAALFQHLCLYIKPNKAK